MTVEIPVSLYITQWAFLCVFGVMLFLLYRQLADLLLLRNRGSSDRGLPIGSQAPGFSFQRVRDDEADDPESFDPGETARVLLFADPLCASCEALLRDIGRMDVRDPLIDAWHPMVVTTAPAEHLHAVPVFTAAGLPVARVEVDVVTRKFNVPYTPFVVALSPTGRVVGAAGVSSVRELRRIVKRGSQEPERHHLPEEVAVVRSR